jgi:hypothetical protein
LRAASSKSRLMTTLMVAGTSFCKRERYMIALESPDCKAEMGQGREWGRVQAAARMGREAHEAGNA